MTDPRDYDQRPGLEDPEIRDFDAEARARSNNAMWGWIAGGAFLVIIIALIFGTTGSGDNQSALNERPASNSVMNNPPATSTPIDRSAPPAAVPPAQGPATTGQGTSNPSSNP